MTRSQCLALLLTSILIILVGAIGEVISNQYKQRTESQPKMRPIMMEGRIH